jgi:putative heme-binding domain-containing protein
MNYPLISTTVLACLALPFIDRSESTAAENDSPKPLKALLIAGGCCHDYAGQHKVLSKGLQALANVQVDVIWTDDKGVNPPLPLYDSPNWADGYDVIIHDECAAGNADVEVMKNILAVHKTVPAVHLHCAMHSFRNGTDLWFKHLGIQSTGHGPQLPIDIQFTDTEHPITKTLKDWTTINEELYNNKEVLDAHPLAMGKQGNDAAIVAWINEKQGARSFSTTIGHNTATVEDPRYLEMVARGLLWSCDKLNADYLKPFTGQNKVTFVPVPVKEAPKPAEAPKGATLVSATAESSQTGDDHYPWHALDGDMETRWCANDGGKPRWFQLEFDEALDLTGAEIAWEKRDDWYQYRIEGSKDGKQWRVLVDASKNTKKGDTKDAFDAKGVRFVRVTGLAQQGDMWISIREMKVSGPKIKSLFPKLDAKATAALKAGDEFKNSGNITPKIVRLTPEQEAEILNDVKVPEGFDLSLFSTSEAANYPVYVAAAPNGDLYVSSDGNGSLGRKPGRGRVLRLRDTDNDGRADQVTEFIKDIDSPRGLIWDHDRLYLLHPPHISVHFDRDGDGVSEESKMLIEGIAFGFKDRPADHTTNGLELGIDGWIYIAGGDFGFMDAVGTDGRHLQHRGGGVIRFRPDGSGLEIFATGTRNILGTPMSPLLDIFARDNTNDGGGWDVRLHHFSGLEDHGYPRMYKNFSREHVAPLADYGGGSGCGSVYIAEPGFPVEWADAPFTCDWGRAGLFHHTVARYGATFQETAEPKVFIKTTRPTDADVDGMSRVYQASWKGKATFDWAGADTGYIVRVKPTGYEPSALPDFEKLKDAELVTLLESPSHIRRLTAQRALLRREATSGMIGGLVALAGDTAKPMHSRIAALYAIGQRGIDSKLSAQVIKSITPLGKDEALQPYVLRALGDMGIDELTAGKPGPAPAAVFVAGMKSEDARTQLEAVVAAARQQSDDAAPAIAALLGDGDPVIAHTAFRALAKLNASGAAFAVLDSPNASESQLEGASFALMRMHENEVVDGLIKRLGTASKLEARKAILSALCRLYQREAEWTGDSWGTRPDTRGPYYQLVTWKASEKILTTLKASLANSTSSEAAFLVQEMNRNRIDSGDALTRILQLASKDDKLVPDAVAQIASSESIPAGGLPILLKAAKNPNSSATTLAQSVEALAKSDDANALDAMLSALVTLDGAEGSGKEQAAGSNAFLNAPKLENLHLAVEKIAAEELESARGAWANAAMLSLASRKGGAPESREMSAKAIDVAWENPKQRIALIGAAAKLKNHYLDGRIELAFSDSDASVVNAAKEAAKQLKIQIPGVDKTPKIGTLKSAEAIAAVVKMKGSASLGEAIFTKATCVACHTVSQDVAQKGPYLGNITETYRRPELAESILDPNKTIAQGFATNLVTAKSGAVVMGFVTDEAGETVTLRDIASQEHTFAKADIAKRENLPTSMMPPGLMLNFSVYEMASLLDYLEKLAKKK